MKSARVREDVLEQLKSAKIPTSIALVKQIFLDELRRSVFFHILLLRMLCLCFFF